jgi:hypothetical protein
MPFLTIASEAGVSLPLANMGVPLFTANLYWQILLLIPIVAIELFIHWRLLKINLFKSFGIALLVNLLSTALGILIVIGFGFLGFGVADRDAPPLQTDYFMIFLLTRVVGLLGMWWLSIQVEFWSGLPFVKMIENKVVKQSFGVANTVSYVFLAVVMISAQVQDFTTSRQEVAIIEQQLAEYDEQCPVIVNSEACDRVFYKWKEAYLQLSRIYRDHNHARKYIKMREQLSNLRQEIAATCERESQRAVCEEVQ